MILLYYLTLSSVVRNFRAKLNSSALRFVLTYLFTLYAHTTTTTKCLTSDICLVYSPILIVIFLVSPFIYDTLFNYRFTLSYRHYLCWLVISLYLAIIY